MTTFTSSRSPVLLSMQDIRQHVIDIETKNGETKNVTLHVRVTDGLAPSALRGAPVPEPVQRALEARQAAVVRYEAAQRAFESKQSYLDGLLAREEMPNCFLIKLFGGMFVGGAIISAGLLCQDAASSGPPQPHDSAERGIGIALEVAGFLSFLVTGYIVHRSESLEAYLSEHIGQANWDLVGLSDELEQARTELEVAEMEYETHLAGQRLPKDLTKIVFDYLNNEDPQAQHSQVKVAAAVPDPDD